MVMQLLAPILGGALGRGVPTLGAVATPVPRRPRQRPFRKMFGVTNGDASYDTIAELAAIIDAQSAGGDYEKLWEFTVPAQQKVRWGFGSPSQVNNQGYMWFAAGDAGVGFQELDFQLRIANNLETNIEVVAELQTETLHTQTATSLATSIPTSREGMLPLPEKVEFPQVVEDSKLQIWVRTRVVTTTVDFVGFQIPATILQ